MISPCSYFNHKFFVVFFLPCPAEEESDRMALVGTWFPGSISPPQEARYIKPDWWMFCFKTASRNIRVVLKINTKQINSVLDYLLKHLNSSLLLYCLNALQLSPFYSPMMLLQGKSNYFHVTARKMRTIEPRIPVPNAVLAALGGRIAFWYNRTDLIVGRTSAALLRVEGINVILMCSRGKSLIL